MQEPCAKQAKLPVHGSRETFLFGPASNDRHEAGGRSWSSRWHSMIGGASVPVNITSRCRLRGAGYAKIPRYLCIASIAGWLDRYSVVRYPPDVSGAGIDGGPISCYPYDASSNPS